MSSHNNSTAADATANAAANSSANSTYIPVTADHFRARLAKAEKIVAEQNLAGFLVSPGPEFQYLTGSTFSSHERATFLVLRAGKDPVAVCPETDVLTLKQENLDELGFRFEAWRDGQSPYEITRRLLEENSEHKAVAVANAMTADHVLRLDAALPNHSIELGSDAMSQLLLAKGEEEISQLAAAAAAIDRVHEQVPALLRDGVTEREVADKLHDLILREHHSIDFIIVGCGENGANPHHSFSDRVLHTGEPVVVDLGGAFGDGYRSDSTRTYVVDGAVDKAPQEFRDAYEVVTRAFHAAREAAKPGATAESIDRAAREIITEAGYGENFSHRLGHGIGLSTHEDPFYLEGNKQQVQEGFTFSIEPGIYVEGKWGMRLEDIVVLEADGPRHLNQQPRELR